MVDTCVDGPRIQQSCGKTMRAKLHTLQYLRAIAAIAVVYSHTVLQVDSYEPMLRHFGDFGVDIFFVLSGFIMVYIAKPADTPKKFMINRIRRVVPLYWFFLFLMAAIMLFMPSLFKSSTFDIGALIKSLLFIPYFSTADPGQIWPLVAPGWSLNYELYFYLLFALSLLFAEHLRIWFVGLAITIIFLISNFSGESAIPMFYGNAIVFEFLLGMLLAKWYKTNMLISNAAAYSMIIIGFAILMIDLPFNRIFAYGIPSAMIVAGALFCKMPENRFCIMLGDSSYALYLCHIFTLGLCRAIFPPLLGEGFAAAVIFSLLSIVVCVVSGIVVHFLIDNWLLKEERLSMLKDITSRPTAL